MDWVTTASIEISSDDGAWTPPAFPQRKWLKIMDKRTRVLVGLIVEAATRAGLPRPAGPGCGICIGLDAMETVHEAPARARQAAPDLPLAGALEAHLPPLWMLEWLPNMPASQAALQTGASGPCHTLAETSGPSGSTSAFTLARQWITAGEADVVLAAACTGGRMRAAVFEAAAHAASRGVRATTPPPFPG